MQQLLLLLLSLSVGFMRSEGRSVIRPSAAYLAHWQVEGWWGHHSPSLCRRPQGQSVGFPPGTRVETAQWALTLLLLGGSSLLPCGASWDQADCRVHTWPSVANEALLWDTQTEPLGASSVLR